MSPHTVYTVASVLVPLQSLYTTERELEKEFGKFGTIAKITVVLDGKTGRSRGFAFVTFEKVEDATEARNAMADTGEEGGWW